MAEKHVSEYFLEIGVIGLLASYLIGTGCWQCVSLAAIAYFLLTSPIARRCIETVPRDFT